MVEKTVPLRLSITRACEALDLSRAKVYELIKNKELHPVKDGSRTFFMPEELQRYVQSRIEAA